MTTRTVHQRPASTVPMSYRQDDEYKPKRPLDGGTSGTSSTTAAAMKLAAGAVYSQANGSRTSAAHGTLGTHGTLVTVSLIKGASGFGFTLADTSRGQVIKTIVDPSRCQDVRPGDVIVAVNGIWLRDRPHSAVVDALRRCDYGRHAELTVLTASSPKTPRQRQGTSNDTDNSKLSTRQNVTENGVNLADLRHGQSQSYVGRTPPTLLDENGGNGNETGGRQLTGVANGVRRGENGIRIYKSANRVALDTEDFGRRLNSSSSYAETASPTSDIYGQSGSYSNSLNGERVESAGSEGGRCHYQRPASSLAVSDYGLSGRNGSVVSGRRAGNDPGLRGSNQTRQRVSENGSNGSSTNFGLERRPPSTTPTSRTEAIERPSEVESAESSSAIGSSSSTSSMTGRLAAIVRRPITPVLQRRSKSQMRAAAEQQERERRRTNLDERPPSTSSLLTRAPSPNSLPNFSGTPDFIPASVYGTNPLDGLLRYRSSNDNENSGGAPRQSTTSSASTSMTAARRPPSSVSAHVTDLSASSSAEYASLPPSSVAVTTASKNHRNMQSVPSTPVPDVESSSGSMGADKYSSTVRQPMITVGRLQSTSSGAIRLNGGSRSSADDPDDAISSTSTRVGTAATVESLFGGRELCNGYNVRTETIYSSPKHAHSNQRRLNQSRSASTGPRLSDDERQSQLPPPPQVISITGPKASAVGILGCSPKSPAIVGQASAVVKTKSTPGDATDQGHLPPRNLNGGVVHAKTAANDGATMEKETRWNRGSASTNHRPPSLTVGRADGDPSTSTMAPPPATTTNEAYYDIELHRGSRGFGFSIRGGKEFDAMPLFVLNIAKGGPADMDGRLMNEDQIVAINGVIAENMTHSEAVSLVQNSCSPLHLIVRRLADINSNIELASDESMRFKRELPAAPAVGSSSLASLPAPASSTSETNLRKSVEPVAGRKYVASTSRLNESATKRR